MPYTTSAIRLAAAAAAATALMAAAAGAAPQSGAARPSASPVNGVGLWRIHRHVRPDGAFTLEGQGWPALKGTWTAAGEKVEITTSGGGEGCAGPGRYAYRVEGGRVSFTLQSDDCEARRMILDRSTWTPAGTPVTRPERRIVRTPGAGGPLPKAAAARRQLAVLPRRAGRRRRRGAEPSGPLGRHDRREHPVEGAPAGPRAFEPGGLGRSHLRHDRGEQRPEGDVSPRPLRRRRRLAGSVAPQMAGHGARHAYRKDDLGARRLRGRAAREAAHQVHLRQRDAGHRWPDRRRVVRVAGRVRVRRERHAALGGEPRPPRSRRLRHPDLRVGDGQFSHHLEGPRHPPGRHPGRLVPARAERRDRRDGVEDGSRRAALVGHADGGRDASRARARHQRVEASSAGTTRAPARSSGALAAARRSRRRRPSRARTSS